MASNLHAIGMGKFAFRMVSRPLPPLHIHIIYHSVARALALALIHSLALSLPHPPTHSPTHSPIPSLDSSRCYCRRFAPDECAVECHQKSSPRPPPGDAAPKAVAYADIGDITLYIILYYIILADSRSPWLGAVGTRYRSITSNGACASSREATHFFDSFRFFRLGGPSAAPPPPPPPPPPGGPPGPGPSWSGPPPPPKRTRRR